jgi:[acyl-carrier-protein] S-malonyltransferase
VTSRGVGKADAVLAVLCPGQGAQSPGFLAPWLEVDGVRGRLHRLSDIAKFDLAASGTDPDVDVVDTAVAQPLIVATGLAVVAAIGALPVSAVVVGHSVGELTAAGIAGALDDVAAVTFARERGRAMAMAAEAVDSGMVALLGGDADAVEAAVAASGCWVANHNGAGQVVAAGERDALDRLAATVPPGTRVRALAVAGAFHTPLMQPAQDAIAGGASWLPVGAARHAVVANADGAIVTGGRDLLARLIRQVTLPVRFDRCLDALERLGVTATLELAPAGVLTALVRRALPRVEAVALRSPDDLDRARELLAEHADAGETWSATWRVVVAPTSGTFHRADVAGTVDGSCNIGAVRNRTGVVDVAPHATGRLLEWLAEDGDPVREGQPLARLAPAGS